MSKPTKTPLRITPGACVATDRWSDVLLTAGSSVVGEIGRAYTDEDWPEISANAALYADAHNTYQKDPTLPSELLRQRDEAVRLLKLAHQTGVIRAASGNAFPEDLMQGLWKFLDTLKQP